eukprot:1265456-Pyramimonas_sp.AAC.1
MATICSTQYVLSKLAKFRMLLTPPSRSRRPEVSSGSAHRGRESGAGSGSSPSTGTARGSVRFSGSTFASQGDYQGLARFIEGLARFIE